MIVVKKSKIAILKSYFRKEIYDILKDTNFDIVKENVYFQDEIPQNKLPEELQAYIIISFKEIQHQYRKFYNYGLTFNFVYNGISSSDEVEALEDWVDERFIERLENQNKVGVWFSEPIKVGLDKTDDGINTETVLTSSYTLKAYFE